MKALAVLGLLIFITRTSFGASDVDLISTLAKDNNEFALNLFFERSKAESGNLFFSPYSISSALAMTYKGAMESTAAEMAKALVFKIPQDQIHKTFSRLSSHLNSYGDQGNKLVVANALWGQEGYKFEPTFVDELKTLYNAELKRFDFKSSNKREEARIYINNWAEKQTQQKIKNIISPESLTYLTRLVLTNAIYFKGAWDIAFDKKKTEMQMFYGQKNKVPIPLMSLTGSFGYFDELSFQVLKMDYKGSALSMIVLLPKDRVDLSSVETNLTSKKMRFWISGNHKQEVKISIPKFTLDYNLSLVNSLKKMGMVRAFTDGANFSGMYVRDQEPLKISEVVHKAFVEVNEEGTEAAAATAIILPGGSVGHVTPAFRADHPFIFIILDNQTGSILFMGRLVDPPKS